MMRILFCSFLALALFAAPVLADKRGDPATIEAAFWSGPVALEARPDQPMWKKARPILFQQDWNGDPYVGQATTVRAVWTPDTLWLLFSCAYDTLTISKDARSDIETDQLWTLSDVAEAFIAPNPADVMHYKEFQVSPAAQWVDLDIDRVAKKHDASWNSGYHVAASIDSANQTWWGVMAIPLKAFGGQLPEPGSRWRLNLFRWEQGPPNRPVVWQPTHQRNFHVPQAFGWLVFKK